MPLAGLTSCGVGFRIARPMAAGCSLFGSRCSSCSSKRKCGLELVAASDAFGTWGDLQLLAPGVAVQMEVVRAAAKGKVAVLESLS